MIPRIFLLTFLAGALSGVPALAQTGAAAKTAGNFTFSGDLSYRAGGVRLQSNAKGPARVKLPELDASANALALDLAGGNTISQVRALGNVNFKLNLAPRGGGAAARIEATCNSATLTPRDRKLVLQGNIKGFYQLAGGAKNTLDGAAATIYYQGDNLVADLTGGVTLRIPAESMGRADELGDLTISAQRAQINQGTGSATFAGNARAISVGGPRAFDVSAPRFTLSRSAAGTLDILKTQGRTLVKIDLPPDPNPTAGAATANKGIGAPTRVEVASDSATVERATSTATFDGNVKGFYRLDQAGKPQNFDFSGTRAVIRYDPTPTGQNAIAGLNLQVTGATVEAPAFNLGF